MLNNSLGNEIVVQERACPRLYHKFAQQRGGSSNSVQESQRPSMSFSGNAANDILLRMSDACSASKLLVEISLLLSLPTVAVVVWAVQFTWGTVLLAA